MDGGFQGLKYSVHSVDGSKELVAKDADQSILLTIKTPKPPKQLEGQSGSAKCRTQSQGRLAQG